MSRRGIRNMLRRVALLVLGLITTTFGFASSPIPAWAKVVSSNQEGAVIESSTASADLPEYSIGPGDVLEVFVWNEAELTRETTVRIDGKITVPLIGDIKASGKSPQQLSNEIGEMLTRFVDAPHVTVGVVQSNSLKYYVIGQVASPGEFVLTGEISVLQALAVAGGLVEFAKRNDILVIRRSPEGQTIHRFHYNKVSSGESLTENILLAPGDTIVVP
jgi:polysaccharide export outer membrane protein